MRQIICLFSLFVGISSLAQTVTETSKSVKIEYFRNKDAQFFYDKLKLPFKMGTRPNGLKFQYKEFVDQTQSLKIYCEAPDVTKKHCSVELFKNASTPMVEVTHEGNRSAVQIFDIEETRLLINSMDTELMDHGGFTYKVLSAEDLNLSISCIQKKDDLDWRQCIAQIFLKPLPVENPTLDR